MQKEKIPYSIITIKNMIITTKAGPFRAPPWLLKKEIYEKVLVLKVRGFSTFLQRRRRAFSEADQARLK